MHECNDTSVLHGLFAVNWETFNFNDSSLIINLIFYDEIRNEMKNKNTTLVGTIPYSNLNI